jgi:hypothetical protein
LEEDRDRWTRCLPSAQQVDAGAMPSRPSCGRLIAAKCRQPINEAIVKIIIFTAFSDTAQYLYANLASWVKASLGVDAALVTGGAGYKPLFKGCART